MKTTAKQNTLTEPKSVLHDSVQNMCDPDHYKGSKTEVIDIIEEFVSNPDRRLTPAQKYNIAQALKYLLRCGLKGGVALVEVDLQKAENYIYRAMTGSWIDREFLNGSGKDATSKGS